MHLLPPPPDLLLIILKCNYLLPEEVIMMEIRLSCNMSARRWHILHTSHYCTFFIVLISHRYSDETIKQLKL